MVLFSNLLTYVVKPELFKKRITGREEFYAVTWIVSKNGGKLN